MSTREAGCSTHQSEEKKKKYFVHPVCAHSVAQDNRERGGRHAPRPYHQLAYGTYGGKKGKKNRT
jgi:hypothetical protein